MTYSIVPNDSLRALCIKKNWFTCGTCKQYDKLFYANANGASMEEIATIIWICSDDEVHCRRDILAALKEARAEWTRSLVSIPEKSTTAKAGYLTAIEEAETMNDLLNIRTLFNEDESLPYDDFVDCFNAFKLKRAELKGDVR